MFSANSRAFLAHLNSSQCINHLAQRRTLEKLCSKFISCGVRSRKETSKFLDPLFTPVDVKPSNDSTKIGEELTGKLNKRDIRRVINTFFRSNEVRALAADNGLDEKIYGKAFASFREFCLESSTLPVDLHVVVSDLVKDVGNPTDIFPYFLRHVKEMYPHLDCMEDLKKIGDIRQPANWYPEARSLNRKFYFHCGPTNSGKTHHALECFYTSQSGIYCAPLKLLAVEVHQKANKKGAPCDLFTGEDVIYVNSNGDHSSHVSCTIEMCPFDKTFDVAVIDEIQMLKDPQRGWAWTRALLGLKAKEIHLCGEEAALEVVDSILCTTNEEIEVKKYSRLTSLTVVDPIESLQNVQPGDCIVCFNKNDIYTVASSLESFGHRVAIVYGSLPPHTKLAQCEKFNDPNNPCNVLVATDAVGMGLNLNIRRIVFYTLSKVTVNEFSEPEKKVISVSQALQISGRAGRYGTQYSEGFVTTLRRRDFKVLEELLRQTPETITHAGLLPTIDQLELFSYYLPKSTLSELIDILIHVSTVDNSLYFMCDLNEFKHLAQMIEHVPLPIRIKYVFCCAPVNRRFPFLSVMFIKFAKLYSLNQIVTLQWICEKIGWPQKKPKNLKELVRLETYHEVLDLYLWLSNRFEEYFPDADVIRTIQKDLDGLIQEGVMNLTRLHTEGEKMVDADEVLSKIEKKAGGLDEEEKPTELDEKVKKEIVPP